jgi:hypothetical protein
VTDDDRLTAPIIDLGDIAVSRHGTQPLGDALQDVIVAVTLDWTWPMSLAFGIGMARLIAEEPSYLEACCVFNAFLEGL